MSGSGPHDLLGSARRLGDALAALAGEASARIYLDDLLSRLDAADPCGSPDEAHRRLLLGLQSQGATVPHGIRPFRFAPALLEQFDDGFEGVLGEGCLRGVRSRGGEEISLAGIVAGVPVDPVTAWMLAASVVTSARARPERPVVVVLDSAPGPAAAMDGSAPLSEYLAHLARAIGWARSQAVAVNVWLVGAADASCFVACAAGASRVVAYPGASLAVSEPSAGAAVQASGLPAGPQWVDAGIVDELAEAGRRVAIAWNTAA